MAGFPLSVCELAAHQTLLMVIKLSDPFLTPAIAFVSLTSCGSHSHRLTSVLGEDEFLFIGLKFISR
jgi:hypothetical protein